MATGVVSGAVADLLQKSPYLTPDQVKARLMKTAWKSMQAFSRRDRSNHRNHLQPISLTFSLSEQATSISRPP